MKPSKGNSKNPLKCFFVAVHKKKSCVCVKLIKCRNPYKSHTNLFHPDIVRSFCEFTLCCGINCFFIIILFELCNHVISQCWLGQAIIAFSVTISKCFVFRLNQIWILSNHFSSTNSLQFRGKWFLFVFTEVISSEDLELKCQSQRGLHKRETLDTYSFYLKTKNILYS